MLAEFSLPEIAEIRPEFAGNQNAGEDLTPFIDKIRLL